MSFFGYSLPFRQLNGEVRFWIAMRTFPRCGSNVRDWTHCGHRHRFVRAIRIDFLARFRKIAID
jgi:hypothetical protein